MSVWEHYQLPRPLGRGRRNKAENAASTIYFRAKMKFAAEQNEGIFCGLSTVDCYLWTVIYGLLSVNQKIFSLHPLVFTLPGQGEHKGVMRMIILSTSCRKRPLVPELITSTLSIAYFLMRNFGYII